MIKHLAYALLICSVLSAGCAGTSSPNPTATGGSASVTNITPTVAAVVTGSADQASLQGVKQYLQTYGRDYLKAGADDLKTDADAYYDAVKAAGFDYKKAWGDGVTVRPHLMKMREAFNQAHTGYESVEGIVAGVPSLSRYDTILDAGTPGSEGGDNVADYTLDLPDGTKLEQPGNFFHNLLEPMIFATDESHLALTGVDVDGDGKIGQGDGLPDAIRLKGAVDGFVSYVDQTTAAIDAWQPTADDAFVAMVTMTPTMDEYFGNWKDSRYVSGSSSTEVRFVAHSRLVDVTQILGSLRTIYAGVKPLVVAKDPTMASQIDRSYADLSGFVDELSEKEKNGVRFTPDQANVLGEEAQSQAQAITGQVSQAAALVGVNLNTAEK